MKTEFKSILDIDNGAIIAKLDKVIMEVMKGFNDPNCDPKGKGKVTLTLTMSDDENGIIGIEDSIKHVPVSLRKNKVAYVDDSQIVHLEVNKYYSDVPRVEITIEEVLHER